jgi:hypothetical protein
VLASNGVSEPVAGFAIGVIVTPAEVVVAVARVRAAAGVLAVDGTLIDVEAGGAATIRVLGIIPVYKSPPYEPANKSEPSIVDAKANIPRPPVD